MKSFSLFHASDAALRRDMFAAIAQSRACTATVVAHIGEFEARRMYAAEGYPSMFRFCVRELHLSEAAAYKRISAARPARRFPVIFAMLADGRLHLTALLLLSKRLTHEQADEMLALAVHRTRREIEQLLAERFPRPDVPTLVTRVAAGPRDQPGARDQGVAPGLAVAAGTAGMPGGTPAPELHEAPGTTPIARPVETQAPQLAPERVTPPEARAQVGPLAPERFRVQFTMGGAAHEAMRYLERLLGRRLTSEDMDTALRTGFEALATAIEKKRFAAADRPRTQSKPSGGRHVPVAVRRVVRERDGDRCTFVAESGRRCEARAHLEYDHIEPVARGGKSTAANLRLRCRAHNQYEAERLFGAGFMHEKRERTRRVGSPQPETLDRTCDRRPRITPGAGRSGGCSASAARGSAAWRPTADAGRGRSVPPPYPPR